MEVYQVFMGRFASFDGVNASFKFQRRFMQFVDFL